MTSRSEWRTALPAAAGRRVLPLALLAAVMLAAGGCVHRPFRQGGTVIDPALCALGDAPADSDGRPLQAVWYMYCVPDNAFVLSEVRQVDPAVVFVPREQARRHCAPSMRLCLGSTGQKGFKTVLERLAKLPYIEAIKLAPAEFY